MYLEKCFLVQEYSHLAEVTRIIIFKIFSCYVQ